MAHPINNMINRLEKRTAIPCNDTCRYWAFPHLERACQLSDVYSVRQGEPCFEFNLKNCTIKEAYEKRMDRSAL